MVAGTRLQITLYAFCLLVVNMRYNILFFICPGVIISSSLHFVHFTTALCTFFYIRGSVHRDSVLIRSNKIQQYAGIYLLQNHFPCFGCPSHPSSGIHKTVTAASGEGRITYLSNNLPPAWPMATLEERCCSDTMTCT